MTPTQIGITLSALSVLLAILIPLLGQYFKRRNKYSYSWRRVLTAVRNLATKIRDDNFKPDVMVVFANGGFIVADLLNHAFDEPLPICSFYSKRTIVGGVRTVTLDVQYANIRSLSGKRVLLVDDVIQSGVTLLKTLDLLQKRCQLERSDIYIVVLSVPKNATTVQANAFAFECEYGSKRPRLPWGAVPSN